MTEIPKHDLNVVNDSIDNKSASELVEAMTSDKRLNGKDLQLVTKLQEKLGTETESIKDGTSNSLNKLKEGLKESTLNMLNNGYSVTSIEDYKVLQSMISLSGLNIVLGNNYETITDKLEGQKNFSIIYNGEGNIQVYKYSNQKKFHNNNFTSDFGSIDSKSGKYLINGTGNESSRDTFDDYLSNNNEFNFNGNLDTLSNSELMESYNNIIIPVALYASPENDISHVINQDVPGSEDNIKTFIQEKLKFKENRENKNKLFNEQQDLLKVKIEDYPQIDKITPELKTSLKEAFDNLQDIIITGSTQLSIIKTVIKGMKDIKGTYDNEIKGLAEVAATETPEPITNQVPEQSEIVTNFSKVVDSVNPCKGVEIKLVDGVCHLKYTKTGNTTQFNLSETGNAKFLSKEGLKGLVDKKLTQWNKTPEVNSLQDNEGQDNEGQDGSIIDNVSENISNGVDYIVEKTKELIDWADELVDGKKVGTFTGANGEEVKIQCDGEKLSIDTSWFGDDIEDYDITQKMSDIVNKDGELIQNTINDLISEYNQKVLEEAYDDINKKSRTSDVVDTVTNSDGETEKVYLKRRDSRDGEINIFIQIGDEKSHIELKDNTYTHSQIENKIKEAKASYNTQVEEKVSTQEKELTEINKEIGKLGIEESVKELIDHKVGNKNFKTIELGTVDEKGDSIDVTLRKYPDGTYRVMIDPDGFGNSESVKLQKDKFTKEAVETTIKELVAEFRMEK